MTVEAITHKVINFFQNGGYVMWFLMFNSISVWYFIIMRSFRLRACSLQNGKNGTFVSELDNGCRHIACQAKRKFSNRLKNRTDNYAKELELIHISAVAELKKHKKIIKTLITVAPLLGLLGTVSGMVETFKSLQFMEFISKSGGISGGISQALTTTQMGIGIATPALIVSKILDSKEREQATDLKKIFNSLMQDTGDLQ